jgi:hypothetical protein
MRSTLVGRAWYVPGVEEAFVKLPIRLKYVTPSRPAALQVQKHLARLQAEKEIAALDALRETFADLAPAVLKAALEEVAWEAPDAIDLLRAFQVDRAPELMVIKEVGDDGSPAGLLSRWDSIPFCAGTLMVAPGMLWACSCT